MRRFASDDRPEPPDLQKIQVTEDWVAPPAPPDASAGMHRFEWDLHYPAPPELSHRRRGGSGIWAPPGRYTVRLSVDGRTLTQPLTVEKDPRVELADEDLMRQFELARSVEAERLRVAPALARAVSLRKQATELSAKASGEAAAALASFLRDLVPLVGPNVVPELFYNLLDAAPTSLLRLNAVLARFQQTVESADAAPTPDAVAG